MGRLRLGRLGWVVTISLLLLLFWFLPACGGHKPAGPSPFPARITLNPSTSYSIQSGATVQFFASAQNGSNGSITPAFTFSSSNPGILDVAPNGFACAGTWNAPLYTVCTPAGVGVVQVTASALGATSPPTLIFVHPPIDNIQISLVPPVASPPPACPNQGPLPAACNLKFNPSAANFCMSQNQVQTLQATAFSQGLDITASVGPFTWTEGNNVVKIAPIVTVSSYNVPTNQATASPTNPGQTQVIASSSGVLSQPYNIETCPVQCIALELSVNGSQSSSATSFVVNKGTSETITATAVDVQGCIVPKPPLTWVSSAPAALTAACAAGTTCTVNTSQAGSATITASCTPPTCNIGFPLNPAGFPAPYIPQPVYPVTAISGLATGAATSTSVLATSLDCSTDVLCSVGIYNVATSNNLPGNASQIPTPPNSLLFDLAGDRAYMGSEFGALVISLANFGSSSVSPFGSLPASGTPLGLVTGKILAVSYNGNIAIFSDTVSTPNQVYVVSASPQSTTALNINSATAAAFSPDGLKAFILGNGGNTLYVYSSLESLHPISLPAPATSIVLNSTGSFALLAGGAPAGSLAAYNSCDNSAVSLSSGTLPGSPLFLKMVPAGNVPLNSVFGGVPIPNLEPAGLDFFFGLDNTGIDIIATNSSLLPLPLPPLPLSLPTLCPHYVVLAQTLPPATTFDPAHINIGQGTFHPINFFLSPDATRAYIVTSDFGVLVYDFNARSTSRIPLVNNATPVAADITADGSLIYVAGSDGLLHELNTALAFDQNQTSFSSLPNSPNNFCFTGSNCALNIVAVKP
ncbi:MAG TPA: hypothetical protein VNX26_05310 [Candidatus Acidoferrum sp.]|jgi:hypothetical protein|nr:hypothetical protein [Candidatus Acidoferrum sp.]